MMIYCLAHLNTQREKGKKYLEIASSKVEDDIKLDFINKLTGFINKKLESFDFYLEGDYDSIRKFIDFVEHIGGKDVYIKKIGYIESRRHKQLKFKSYNLNLSQTDYEGYLTNINSKIDSDYQITLNELLILLFEDKVNLN